jgi:hypothetical protein
LKNEITLKVPIDLAGISGYNGIEAISLWGMAFAFAAFFVFRKELYCERMM